MIKLFSIFISSIILIQSFNIHFGDVLKLNEMMEHAKLHKNRYGDDLLVFLSKHYGELKQSHKEQHTEEEKEHSHPPINHDCGSQFQAPFVINIVSFLIKNGQIPEKPTIYFYLDNFSSFEKQKIFQPPRLA